VLEVWASMDILKLIGQRLKEARETCGFKQEEVAQKIGITREYLSLLENGRRNPPLRMLQKLAELYGCPTMFPVPSLSTIPNLFPEPS